MCICSFLVWKNACLNYREFDLEGDLMGVPHTWYLSAQSFITLLKLTWGEYDIVAMNEWKKKCVGLHRTWVSKRTVNNVVLDQPSHLHDQTRDNLKTNFSQLRYAETVYKPCIDIHQTNLSKHCWNLLQGCWKWWLLVLCKPTHFFFHSFIATTSYSLQASFNSVMKDWADKNHVWGTPTRSPLRSNSR